MKSLFALHAYMHVVHVIRCNRGCVPFEINKNFSISNPNPLSDAFFLFFLRIAGKRHTYIVEPPVSGDHKIMLGLYVGWWRWSLSRIKVKVSLLSRGSETSIDCSQSPIFTWYRRDRMLCDTGRHVAWISKLLRGRGRGRGRFAVEARKREGL